MTVFVFDKKGNLIKKSKWGRLVQVLIFTIGCPKAIIICQ